MQSISRAQLPSPLQEALASTVDALNEAWCPYSGLQVAAGLVLEDETCVTGVNYESASYGLTLCAERTAIARAQAAHGLPQANALVLCARSKDPHRPLHEPLTPCGACRQWIAELAERLQRDFPVICTLPETDQLWQFSARELLPHGFHLSS